MKLIENKNTQLIQVHLKVEKLQQLEEIKIVD